MANSKIKFEMLTYQSVPILFHIINYTTNRLIGRKDFSASVILVLINDYTVHILDRMQFVHTLSFIWPS